MGAVYPWSVKTGWPVFGQGQETTERELVDMLASGGSPRVRRETERWVKERRGRLMDAGTVEQIERAFDGFDSMRFEIEQQERAQVQSRVMARQQDLASRVARRRQEASQDDPGPVSRPQVAARWAASSALPGPLYHATPYGPEIMQVGLKARSRMQQHRQVLGGGPEDVVSVVTEREPVIRLAAALQAINEAYDDPEGVFRWFERHWLPWLEGVSRSEYESIMEAGKGPPGPSPDAYLIKKIINQCSYYCGFFAHWHGRVNQPWMRVPRIYRPPPHVSPSSVGVITAYAFVDAVVWPWKDPERPARIESPVPGLARALHTRGDPGWGDGACPRVRLGGERRQDWRRAMRQGDSRLADLPWADHASFAVATDNAAEAGEIRVCGEDLTVVGFEPVIDWRSVLMSPRKNGSAKRRRGSREALSPLGAALERHASPRPRVTQRNRCVVAVFDSLIERGEPEDHNTVSRAYAICNSQLGRYGYLKPGTLTPTALGMLRGWELGAEDDHDEIMSRFDAMNAMAKRSRAAAKRGGKPAGRSRGRPTGTDPLAAALARVGAGMRGAANVHRFGRRHPLNQARPTRGSRRCGREGSAYALSPALGRTNAEIMARLEPLREAMDEVFLCETAYGTCKSEAPSAGHCMIASMAVQDLFGGEIVGGEVNRTPHYWNRINGRDLDLTGDQFGFDPIQVKRGTLYGPMAFVFSREPHEIVGEPGSELSRKHRRFMSRLLKALGKRGLTDHQAHLEQYGLT